MLKLSYFYIDIISVEGLFRIWEHSCTVKSSRLSLVRLMMIILCNLVDDRLKYLKRISSLSLSLVVVCEYPFSSFLWITKVFFTLNIGGFFSFIGLGISCIIHSFDHEKARKKERRDFNAYMLGVKHSRDKIRNDRRRGDVKTSEWNSFKSNLFLLRNIKISNVRISI